MIKLSLRRQPSQDRFARMRSRDSKRFTLVYREAAWNKALDEARNRSFLSSLILIMTWVLRGRE